MRGWQTTGASDTSLTLSADQSRRTSHIFIDTRQMWTSRTRFIRVPRELSRSTLISMLMWNYIFNFSASSYGIVKMYLRRCME